MTTSPVNLAPVALLAFALTVAATASAQSDGSKAAAEALFQQGRSLLQQRDYAEACAKLAASQKLEAAIGTLLFLGECNERLGKNATAWAAFLEAESLAERQGDGERQHVASVRAAALAPMVSRLALQVAEPAAGLTIRHNGVELPQASWDTPLPVDQGEHRIEALAPDKEPWVRTVAVNNGGAVVAVDVPRLKDAPQSPTASPSEVAPVGVGGSNDGSDATSEGMSALAITGLVALGVGAVGLGVGTAFGVMADGTNEESLDHCRTPTLCSPTGLELREDAQSEATLSTALFVTGGVLAAAGLTVFLLAPSEQSAAGAEGAGAAASYTQVTFSAAAGPGQGGLFLQGQW